MLLGESLLPGRFSGTLLGLLLRLLLTCNFGRSLGLLLRHSPLTRLFLGSCLLPRSVRRPLLSLLLGYSLLPCSVRRPLLRLLLRHIRSGRRGLRRAFCWRRLVLSDQLVWTVLLAEAAKRQRGGPEQVGISEQ